MIIIDKHTVIVGWCIGLTWIIMLSLFLQPRIKKTWLMCVCVLCVCAVCVCVCVSVCCVCVCVCVCVVCV